jgi:hypothetical protein
VYKRRSLFLLALAMVVLGLGGIFLVGCGSSASSDPFAKMVVTSNVPSVNLYLEINDFGQVNLSESTRSQEIVFTVSGAPSAVSRIVTARSLDRSVADVEVKEFSGGNTTVVVNAVNSGRTRIEALSAAGGRVAYVDVVVDIPAKDLSVKRDVYFGVLRGERLALSNGDFNFYSTATRVTSDFSRTTLNNIDYQVFGARDGGRVVTGFEFDALGGLRPSIVNNGTALAVPVGYPYQNVIVRPVLQHLQRPAADIIVHVFDPLPTSVNGSNANRINITDHTTGTSRALPIGVRNVPYLDMVLNAPPAPASPAVDPYPVKNVARLGLSLSSSVGYSSSPGTSGNWGYFITNRDINALNVADSARNGVFDLVAHGTGNVTLDITFFPIGRDENNNPIRFDFAYHSALQRTQSVSVEIRNVFREETMVFTKDGIEADSLNVFSAAAGHASVLENFRLGVLEETPSGSRLSATSIANTHNVADNNHIFFYAREVKNDGGADYEDYVFVDEAGSSVRVGVLDLFNISFARYSFQMFSTAVNAAHVDPQNPRGIPYNNMFSISIKHTDILDGRNLVLYAASIHDFTVVSGVRQYTTFARIPLNCIQAIGEMELRAADKVYDEENQVFKNDEWQAGEVIDIVHPVIGAAPNPIQFFVETDETHAMGALDVKFNGEGAGAFREDNADTGGWEAKTIKSGSFFQLGYAKTVLPAVGSGQDPSEEFIELFQIHQRQGNLSGGKLSRFEVQVTAPTLIVEALNYSFEIMHPSRVGATLNIVPLPVWTADPIIDINEISGDVIYQKLLPGDPRLADTSTLMAFVRLGGSYGLDVRTTPAISLAGFDIVEYNNTSGGFWEPVKAPDNLTVVSLGPTRKWISADLEGVYDFRIKVHAQNDEIIGMRNSVFLIRIVVVDPVISAEILPNGVEVLSKRSLGYDLALGLDQSASVETFDLVLGYESGAKQREFDYEDGVFQRRTIIDFSFPNMQTLASDGYTFINNEGPDERRFATHGASDVIDLRREKTGTSVDDYTNRFVMQGLRPSGGELNITFRIRQVYELDGIVVPIDFALDGGSGGMTVNLFANIVDAVMIQSILPFDIGGDVLDITLNAPGMPVGPVSTSVRTTLNPAQPYDNGGVGYLGYGFLRKVGTGLNQRYELTTNIQGTVETGRWSVISVNSQEIIKVNVLTGEIIATRQSISPAVEITLVIYALDSVQAGMFPATYALVPIQIFNRAGNYNQRVINNEEQFIDAFYERTNTTLSILESAKLVGGLRARRDLGASGNSCHFELSRDIDLSYQDNGITRHYMLPPIPSFGSGSSAVFKGSRWYTLAGGAKVENYTISNFRMMSTSQYYAWEWEDTQQTRRIANYGFFGSVGPHGVVEGVSFANVSGFIAGLTNVHETRFGVIAAVNLGVIRDVSVTMSATQDEFIFLGGSSTESISSLHNIGFIVGRNEASGVIEETERGLVHAGGLFLFQMHQSRVAPVNFGGIVGLNNGSVVKSAGIAALRENVVTNSSAAMIVTGGRQSFGWGYDNTTAHGSAFYVNVGGIAGRNNGLVDGYSSEAVIYNSAFGNTGGVVGFNAGQRDTDGSQSVVNGTTGAPTSRAWSVPRGVVRNCQSNSVVYARSAMGGVVGRNFSGLIENCHYDLYLNESASSKLWEILRVTGLPPSNWGADRFYAGLIVATDGDNHVYGPGFSVSGGVINQTSSPTVVGGVVGVNDSGNVRFSFASSAFSNQFSSIEMLDNMPYRGDVFIYNVLNVMVGGVIGRQDSTVLGANGRSEILGCYSSLSVFFDAGTKSTGAPMIGGIVGHLNSARANFEYCYSNVKVNIVRDTTVATDRLSYSGYFAFGGASTTDFTRFNHCYSIITGSTVVRGAVTHGANNTIANVDPVFIGDNSDPRITYHMAAYVSSSASKHIVGTIRFADASALRAAFNNNTWVARAYFTYYDTETEKVASPAIPQNNRLFPFPLIFDGVTATNPLVMASPSTITPTLRPVREYAAIYGESRNNQGGFNYVIPNEGGTRAALFYTDGVGAHSALAANRYYFADLFTVNIDPEIASRRITYKVVGSSDIVRDGIEIDAFGQARHFLDLKGVGSFDIVMSATRFIDDGTGEFVMASNRITFDSIRGIKEMTATTGVAGLVGQKSLLNGDTFNITNGHFTIQKNTPFVLSGFTDRNFDWDVKIFGGSLYHICDDECDDPCDLEGETLGIDRISANGGAFNTLDLDMHTATIPRDNGPNNPRFVERESNQLRMISGLSASTSEFGNNTTFVLNQIGQMEFAIVPYIAFGDQEYICYPLAFRVSVSVFGGAIELGFEQSTNTDSIKADNDIIGGSVIDPSTSTRMRGVFTTDIVHGSWGASTTNEEKLLDLMTLRYITGTRVERLFTDYAANMADYRAKFGTANAIPLPSAVSTVPQVGGQHVDLFFELHVDAIENVTEFGGMSVAGAGYQRYHFHVTAGVLVDQRDELYSGIRRDNVSSALNALTKTVEGMIVAEEILASEHVDVVERTAFVKIDIIAQDLQSAEIQHFSNAQWVYDDNGVRTENLRIDESQHASSNIFTDRDRGGLLKVYAIPYFANIESFTLRHDRGNENRDNKDKPWMQHVGNTETRNNWENSEPIYEEWSIRFVQMVLDISNPANPVYTPLDVLHTGRFHQVSTTWLVGNTRFYGWTGIYYIQTRLFEPEFRIIGERGEREAIIGASRPIASGKAFALVAEFTTNAGRKEVRPFTVFTAEAPGLYFNYGDGFERTTTRQAEQAIGTEVSFTVTGVPEGKTTITRRRLFIGSREVEVAEGATTDGDAVSDLGVYAGLARTTYDVGAREYKLWISERYFSVTGLNLRDTPINIKFEYSREEDHGGTAQDEAWLEITPVLFRVRGFGIDGWSGNTRQITGHNHENVALNVISTHSSHETLRDEIAVERERLRVAINLGENRNWLLWKANEVVLNTTTDAFDYYPDNPNINFFLGERENRTKFILDAGRPGTSTFHVEMFVTYASGVPQIMQNLGAGARRVVSPFTVITVQQSSSQNLTAIYQYNAHFLRTLMPGGHYIIMEDLVLNDWTPAPFRAASLDGNGKRITINSFNFDGMPRDIGLFSTVGMDDGGNPITTMNGVRVSAGDFVLKNINVALPSVSNSLDIVLSSFNYNVQQMSNNNRINIGLLAGRNAGIITNCAVVNQQQFTQGVLSYFDANVGREMIYDSHVDYERSTYLKNLGRGAQQLSVLVGNRNLNVRVGGLVGENLARGVISNSRVMIDVVASPYYEPGNSSEINVADMNIAGFVAENFGTIVSSFFRDGNITNNVRASTRNLTSGFVGVNHSSAIISACYVMGVSDEIDTTTAGRLGCVMYGEISSLDGSVAGFVQTNNGTIEDCYVNVIITWAIQASGFVMINTGTIRNCLVNNVRTPGFTYYGFANTAAGMTSASGLAGITNCRYVIGGAVVRSFDGRIPQFELDEQLMNRLHMFDGYSIDLYPRCGTVGDCVVAGCCDDPITVWQMEIFTDNFGNVIEDSTGFPMGMPRLVSANEIAWSVRIFVPRVTAQTNNTYRYAINELGSKKNPVVIANGQQFNDIIYVGSGADRRNTTTSSTSLIDYESNIFDQNIRLVNNIDLRRRSSGGDLPDASPGIMTYGTIFKGATFDGNGLSVNNISFNANTAVNRGLRSVGLFSKLEYATVKNTTFTYIQIGSTQVSIDASNATYVGGLAGVSINSTISDVHLAGSAIVQGRSIVGGIIGVAVVFETGETPAVIQSVTGNVPVRSMPEGRQNTNIINHLFEGADDYIQHSYYDISVAGGLFGMITAAPRADYWVMLDGGVPRNVPIDILRKDKDGQVQTGTTAPASTVHVRNIGNNGNSHMSVTGEVIGGLVGVVDNGIIIENARIDTSGSGGGTDAMRGKFFIGGLVGANLGTLRDSGITSPRGMNLQSMAGNDYVFYGQGRLVTVEGQANPIRIHNNHHGMTVGGAVGFNRGIVDTVRIEMPLGATSAENFSNVFRLGGIVGENKGVAGEIGQVWNKHLNGAQGGYQSANGGTIRNSTFGGGDSMGLHGGFYIGGLVGLNHGTNTVVADNEVVLPFVANWGTNFGGTIGESSIFRTTRNATYDILTRVPGSRYVFILQDEAGQWIYNRTYFTGAYIGVNQDTGLAQSVIDSNTGHAFAPLQRKVGLYTYSVASGGSGGNVGLVTDGAYTFDRVTLDGSSIPLGDLRDEYWLTLVNSPQLYEMVEMFPDCSIVLSGLNVSMEFTGLTVLDTFTMSFGVMSIAGLDGYGAWIASSEFRYVDGEIIISHTEGDKTVQIIMKRV